MFRSRFTKADRGIGDPLGQRGSNNHRKVAQAPSDDEGRNNQTVCAFQGPEVGLRWPKWFYDSTLKETIFEDASELILQQVYGYGAHRRLLRLEDKTRIEINKRLKELNISKGSNEKYLWYPKSFDELIKFKPSKQVEILKEIKAPGRANANIETTIDHKEDFEEVLYDMYQPLQKKGREIIMSMSRNRNRNMTIDMKNEIICCAVAGENGNEDGISRIMQYICLVFHWGCGQRDHFNPSGLPFYFQDLLPRIWGWNDFKYMYARSYFSYIALKNFPEKT